MNKNKLQQTIGGVKIKDSTAVTQGDIVGRDKVIQNITILSNFIDFAIIEDILPKPTNQVSFDNIYDSIENSTQPMTSGDMYASIVIASEIFSNILTKFIIVNKPLGFREKWHNFWHGITAVSSLRNLIIHLSFPLYRELKRQGYWDGYSEFIDVHPSFRYINGTYEGKGENIKKTVISIKTIWLVATQFIWEKHFHSYKRFGLSYIEQETITTGLNNAGFTIRQSIPIFLVQSGSVNEPATEAHFNPILSPKDCGKNNSYYFDTMTSEETQVFLIGLFIDLVRITGAAQQDKAFWQNMLHNIGSKKGNGNNEQKR